MNFDVIHTETGDTVSALIAIDPRDHYRIASLMAFAGIDKASIHQPYGWQYDTHTASVFVVLPFEFRSKIDRAIDIMRQVGTGKDREYSVEFKNGVELK